MADSPTSSGRRTIISRTKSRSIDKQLGDITAKFAEFSAQLAVITERQDANRQASSREIQAISDSLDTQTKDLKKSIVESTKGWENAVRALRETTETKITGIELKFEQSLDNVIKKFDEKSKEFVLQVEFSAIRYIVITLGLGVLVQAFAKYILNW